ncbi:MAG: hypothetical protein WCK39_04330 [Methanomassiliicoccales archaeon]
MRRPDITTAEGKARLFKWSMIVYYVMMILGFILIVVLWNTGL